MAYTGLPVVVRDFGGVPSSGTFAARPKNAHNGAMYYAEDIGRLLFFDACTRTWFRADGRTLYVPAQKYLSDLFCGPALASAYASAIGSDTDPGDAPVIDTDDADGSVLGNTGDAGTGVAADGSALSGPVDWEMEEATGRGTVFLAELELEAITNVELFVGWSDVLPSTTLEMPFHFTSGTAITSVADNACGMLFDTTADTDTIRCVGTKATTDATPVNTGEAPTAATMEDFLIIVDPEGNMDCFFNGVHVGTVADAIAPGTDACPIIVANATTTADRYWRCRRFAAHQDW